MGPVGQDVIVAVECKVWGHGRGANGRRDGCVERNEGAVRNISRDQWVVANQNAPSLGRLGLGQGAGQPLHLALTQERTGAVGELGGEVRARGLEVLVEIHARVVRGDGDGSGILGGGRTYAVVAIGQVPLVVDEGVLELRQHGVVGGGGVAAIVVVPKDGVEGNLRQNEWRRPVMEETSTQSQYHSLGPTLKLNIMIAGRISYLN